MPVLLSIRCNGVQAFAKDAKLLQLLKALITQQASLADKAASQMTDAQIKQLQQTATDAGVNSPEALKLDAEQVCCSRLIACERMHGQWKQWKQSTVATAV